MQRTENYYSKTYTEYKRERMIRKLKMLWKKLYYRLTAPHIVIEEFEASSKGRELGDTLRNINL